MVNAWITVALTVFAVTFVCFIGLSWVLHRRCRRAVWKRWVEGG